MTTVIRLSFFFSLSVLVKEFKMVSWCTLVCLLGVLTITAAGENRLLLVHESIGHTNIRVPLREDVSYFLCCTRYADVPFPSATKEIGDVCRQASLEMLAFIRRMFYSSNALC